ncbi:hypothetical protein FOA52_003092 [Chlamydomonas sp. UWO 241]|nr:hypothetical protein FOA52_003092 [Chlamydomonas sp. UWO 241]
MEAYEFIEKIAEGAYGSVWKCLHRATGQAVAVKKLKDATPLGSEEYEFAIREVKLLQMMNHVNVVRLIEAYQSTRGRLYLVFEYVEHTMLGVLKLAFNHGQHLPSAQVKSMTYQLLQSLKYMHTNNIIHRDLKPSNVLVNDSGTVKLCDFGFARPMSPTQAVAPYTTYVVTRWYRAPEVLVGSDYGPSVDIWALGCIVAEMLLGKPLFPGRHNNDQLWLVLQVLGVLTDEHMRQLEVEPQFASFRVPLSHEYTCIEAVMAGCHPYALDFVKSCLHPDPEQRLTAAELLQTPYMVSVDRLLPREVQDAMAAPAAAPHPALDAAAGGPAGAAAAAASGGDKRAAERPAHGHPHPHPHANHRGGDANTASDNDEATVDYPSVDSNGSVSSSLGSAAEGAIAPMPAAQVLAEQAEQAQAQAQQAMRQQHQQQQRSALQPQPQASPRQARARLSSSSPPTPPPPAAPAAAARAHDDGAGLHEDKAAIAEWVLATSLPGVLRGAPDEYPTEEGGRGRGEDSDEDATTPERSAVNAPAAAVQAAQMMVAMGLVPSERLGGGGNSLPAPIPSSLLSGFTSTDDVHASSNDSLHRRQLSDHGLFGGGGGGSVHQLLDAHGASGVAGMVAMSAAPMSSHAHGGRRNTYPLRSAASTSGTPAPGGPGMGGVAKSGSSSGGIGSSGGHGQPLPALAALTRQRLAQQSSPVESLPHGGADSARSTATAGAGSIAHTVSRGSSNASEVLEDMLPMMRMQASEVPAVEEQQQRQVHVVEQAQQQQEQQQQQQVHVVEEPQQPQPAHATVDTAAVQLCALRRSDTCPEPPTIDTGRYSGGMMLLGSGSLNHHSMLDALKGSSEAARKMPFNDRTSEPNAMPYGGRGGVGLGVEAAVGRATAAASAAAAATAAAGVHRYPAPGSRLPSATGTAASGRYSTGSAPRTSSEALLAHIMGTPVVLGVGHAPEPPAQCTGSSSTAPARPASASASRRVSESGDTLGQLGECPPARSQQQQQQQRAAAPPYGGAAGLSAFGGGGRPQHAAAPAAPSFARTARSTSDCGSGGRASALAGVGATGGIGGIGSSSGSLHPLYSPRRPTARAALQRRETIDGSGSGLLGSMGSSGLGNASTTNNVASSGSGGPMHRGGPVPPSRAPMPSGTATHRFLRSSASDRSNSGAPGANEDRHPTSASPSVCTTRSSSSAASRSCCGARALVSLKEQEGTRTSFVRRTTFA